MDSFIVHFLEYGTSICCIAFFIILLISNHLKDKKGNLSDLLAVALAGSSIPTGLVLLLSAFNDSAISHLSDSSTYMVFAGLALLYVAFTALKDKL